MQSKCAILTKNRKLFQVPFFLQGTNQTFVLGILIDALLMIGCNCSFDTSTGKLLRELFGWEGFARCVLRFCILSERMTKNDGLPDPVRLHLHSGGHGIVRPEEEVTFAFG